LDDFVICVSKPLVPLDAFHRGFVRHGQKDELICREGRISRGYEGPAVVAEGSLEGAMAILESHAGVIVKYGLETVQS
jgi:hypothetical protein